MRSPSLPIDPRHLLTSPDVIDVRTPAEFLDDHVPGALNAPVLSNEEREEIGTLFKQVSPFVARRRGAALVSQNIARHLITLFSDKPQDWSPTVMCWRGGQRSAAMTHILRAVGWNAQQVPGGYKAWRRHVIDTLYVEPLRLRFQVIAGPTGTGKSELLKALKKNGEQVLDLEALACHRGSVLGDLPECPQPSQRFFESLLYQTLCGFSSDRPVYVEAESRRIGLVHVPETLILAMRDSECWIIDAPVDARVQHIKKDYAHLIDDPEALHTLLARLHRVHSKTTLARWSTLATAGDIDQLVQELLETHYDPLYARSSVANYTKLNPHRKLFGGSLEPGDFERMFRRMTDL